MPNSERMPESKKKYQKYNSSELWLCIEKEGDGMCGTLQTPCMAIPIPFENLAEPMLKMNQIFDAINFPQRFTKQRCLEANAPVTPDWVLKSLREPEPMFRAEDAGLGCMLYFFVRVYCRRNASWQGELHCINSARKICFRSVLELMEIITDAVQELRVQTPQSALA